MQIRALFEAMYQLQNEKVPVHVEIMIPIIMNESELKLLIYGKKIEGGFIRGLVDVEEEVRKAAKARKVPYKIGTMIELPVAALGAGEIARGRLRRRRDRPLRPVLLLRHQRPDPDHTGIVQG
jgi:pyruvate,orthophosphate dikinase